MSEAARKGVADVANAISAFSESIADYPRLVETIVHSMARLCGGFCSIGLVSADGQWLETAALYDEDPEARALIAKISTAARLPLSSKTPASEVIRTGVAFMTPAFTSEMLRARFAPEAWPLLEQLQIKGVMQVPLRSQGSVVGVLTVNRHGPDAKEFDQADLDVAQHVADHAALSLINARRFDEAQRINRRLRVTSIAAREFAENTGDLKSLLNVIANRASDALRGICVLRLISADGEYLDQHAASSNDDPDLLEVAQAADEIARWRVNEGVAGRIVATGDSVLIEHVDATAISHFPAERQGLLQKTEIASVVGAPLRARGGIIGTLTASRRSSAPAFTPEDLRLLQDLAISASLAISNAQLLERARGELSERKRAEAALTLMEDQLRQAQKMDAVGKLAGGIAHDFNNVLSVILSYSALLTEQFDPSDTRAADVHEIQRAAQRAAGLTHQLLAFSRQQVSQPRLVDLNKLIRGLHRMFETLTGARLALHLVLDPNLGRCQADPGHLEQVLMNLVVNARDAMPDAGNLTIETANVELDQDYAERHLDVVPGPHVMVAVSDTGIGMDRATQDRIFEPFFTTKEVGKGTGLGLSTTFGIVKQNGGSIWVYSEVGRGTTFKVYLPRSFEAESPVRRSEAPTRLAGDETILLVADEEQVRTVARTILEAQGYRVLEAADGDAALALASRHAETIELLFTDVVMPGMGGTELAERLLELRPKLRVLYASGYTEKAIVHHRVLDGGLALLQKPFTPISLLQKVREVLDG